MAAAIEGTDAEVAAEAVAARSLSNETYLEINTPEESEPRCVIFDTPNVSFPSFAPYHDKIISFCLWGASECYNYLMLENVLLAQRIYPGWVCYIFYNETCMPKIIDALQKQPNVRLIFMSDKTSKASNMFWRFIPCFESDSIVLVRDCDSVLNERERAAVQEFEDSSCNFHIMRDSVYHKQKIMGGMWGCRNGVLRPLYGQFHDFMNGVSFADDKRNLDQQWLDIYVYPLIQHTSMVHATDNKYEAHTRGFPRTTYKGRVGAILLHAPLARKYFGEENEKLARRPQYRC